MSCSFVLGATTKTIRNPAFPENNPEFPRQTLGKSGGGKHWVYQRGTSGKQIKLSFVRMTDTEKADLLSFIQDTAVYMTNTFTYNDPAAVAHTTMRFIDFGSWFERIRGTTRWNISLILERDD